MKKVLFLSLIFFLGLALAGFNPVKADSVVVNGHYTDTDTLSQADYDELQNTALLLEYLRQGGVIDTSNVNAGYSASDLVSDFGEFVKEVLGDVVDVINPFQSKFEYTPLGNAMLNNNIYKFLGQLPFYALNGPQEPDTPDIPENYIQYIDKINGNNGEGFDYFWKNGLLTYSTSFNIQINPNYESFTFINPIGNILYSAFNTNSSVQACKPVSIYIVSTGDNLYSYSVTCDIVPFFNIPTNNPSRLYFQFGINSPTNIYVANGYSTSYTWDTVVTDWQDSVSNQSLDLILNYISIHYRNVNIYVDGVPWSIVHNTQGYTLQIYNDTVPDIATNDYGYVHWVYDYEIFFRIDKIWDILQDILDNMGNGGQTIIRWPDIDDVIVDVDGQPAVAVKIYTPDSNIDEEYLSKYGPLIPVFIPLSTPVINDSDILLIASTPMSALPDDLLDVFGYIFIGMLFVCFIHRLLE